MTWTDYPWTALVSLITLAAAVAVLALDERNRRKFSAKEDMDASLQRVHRRIDSVADDCQGAISLMATVEDRVGDLERRQDRLEERHHNQWQAVTKDVAETVGALRDVTRELRELSEMQRVLFDRMER